MSAFESVALKIDNSTDEELLHAFIWGLKDRLKGELRIREPKTLKEAAKFALDIEERLYGGTHHQH
jgi:hypothetical protein